MTTRIRLLALGTLAATAGLASAQGDMVVHRIGGSGSSSNFNYYGQSSGTAAYSVSSQSCNIGNQDLIWTSGNGQTHPVISQNVFRLKDDRFEHIGQSWLKHGFCALCEGGCSNGMGDGCASVLRVGCADTYGANLNDGKGGGPKFTVDPVSGNHQHPDPAPTGNATIRGRLQLPVGDVTPASNPGAEYILEGMYLHYQDHQNGFSANNATWRKISFTSGLQIAGTNEGASPNNVGETGVHGWKSLDSGVQIQPVVNADEGGNGIHGHYDVGSRVHDNGDGTYDYVYMVYNLSSTQGAGSFSIPYGGSAQLSDVWFNDVDYHSGELQDGADWAMTETDTALTWTCPQSFAQNPNANAINWATGYSFGFTADVPPQSGVGEISLFEPGVGNVLTFPVDGPGTGRAVGIGYCYGSGGSGLSCPCLNPSAGSEGCTNSTGNGATLFGVGIASVAADSVVLGSRQAPANNVGVFFSGTNQIPAGQVFGDGLRCVAGQITRLEIAPTNSQGHAESTVGISGLDGAQAGQTRYYQYWFRDPQGSLCGSGFNLSSGLAISWTN